jgi:hypothetical protein
MNIDPFIHTFRTLPTQHVLLIFRKKISFVNRDYINFIVTTITNMLFYSNKKQSRGRQSTAESSCKIKHPSDQQQSNAT